MTKQCLLQWFSKFSTMYSSLFLSSFSKHHQVNQFSFTHWWCLFVLFLLMKWVIAMENSSHNANYCHHNQAFWNNRAVALVEISPPLVCWYFLDVPWYALSHVLCSHPGPRCGMGEAHSRHFHPGTWSLKADHTESLSSHIDLMVPSTIASPSFQVVFLRHEDFQPTFPYFLKIILTCF